MMSLESHSCYLVVGAEPTDLQNDSTLSHVYKKELYFSGTNDTHSSPQMSLAENSFRHLHVAWAHIPRGDITSRTTSQILIETFICVFAHNGIPEELVIDIGSQYTLNEMKAFTASYSFQHTTSSPYYPRGNGLAERTVKTIKALL